METFAGIDRAGEEHALCVVDERGGATTKIGRSSGSEATSSSSS
ncbi:MAG TPA: hypothetical protein VEK39_00155 [Solirubrobacterales bacterium]|nr:hypothetical protein [Solirubrobacterales bacterium]